MLYNYLFWATHFTAAISATLLQGWVATACEDVPYQCFNLLQI